MDSKLKHILLLVTVMCVTLPSQAVLPEGNVDRTMVMLFEDMKVLEQNLDLDLRRFDDRLMEFRNGIAGLDDACDEAGLVLYTQDERYIYGSLQATQSMRDVVSRIQSCQQTILQLEDELTTISCRYNKLSIFLEKLKTRKLSPAGSNALRSSQAIADSLHVGLRKSILSLEKDKAAYTKLLDKANELDKYNDEVLATLHRRIFTIGNEPFPYILSHFSSRLHEFVQDLKWTFLTGQNNTDDWNSIEDEMHDVLSLFTYLALFAAIVFYVITRVKRLCPQWAKPKSGYYALIVGLSVKVSGFFVAYMMLGAYRQLDIVLTIESELYILALLVTVSTTIRLDRKSIGRALVSYLPMLLMAYVLIDYREDLVAVSTVTFTVPFLFLLALLCQAAIIFASSKRLEKIDRRVCWANLSVTIISFGLTYYGFSILATMLFLFWIGVVNGIMFIAFCTVYLGKKHFAKDGVVRLTINKFFYPMVFPAIVLLSLSWVAHIYNFTSWFRDLLAEPFINMPDRVGVISTSKLLFIYGLGVCVNYAVALIKLLQRNPDNRQGQVAVAITIGNIFVWLLYVVAVLVILDVNRGGLIAAVGGASVGIGFALKDTFENFFCGISLMAGRVRPGDILEYEGERGKVLDVGIISTRMVTENGLIMAMPNRQLFEKNFKNMTRNHRVEIRHIMFDISAENDMDFVRSLILDSFHGIDGVSESRKHVVVMRHFGCGIVRVELKVWIDTEKYLATEPAVREAVFKAFRENNIEAATFLQKFDSETTASIMKSQPTII